MRTDRPARPGRAIPALLLAFAPVLIQTASVDGWAASGRPAIVSPTTAGPATVTANAIFAVRLDLPLPITPPPGVQQQRAIADWTVELARAPWPARDGSRLVYRPRVVRIRPVARSRYDLTAICPPEAAPGLYTLSVRAPGFDATWAEAVRIGPPARPTPGRVLTRFTDADELVVENLDSSRLTVAIELVVPDDWPGLAVTNDGSPLLPSRVGLASTPTGDLATARRLLVFDLRLAAANADRPSATRLVLARTPPPSCDLRARFGDEGRAGLDRAARLEVSSRARQPAFAYWVLDAGRAATGAVIEHRFAGVEPPEARVLALDEAGRRCVAAVSGRFTHTGAAVSCTPAPGQGRGPGLFGRICSLLFTAARWE